NRARDAAINSYRDNLAPNAPLAGVTALIQTNLFTGVDAAVADAPKKLNEAATALGNLNISLDNNAFAAQDAAEAERALAEARTQAVLRNANLARELSVTQAQYSRFTGDQAKSELQRLRDDNQALFAARRELQGSGDTSEEAVAQIAA